MNTMSITAIGEIARTGGYLRHEAGGVVELSSMPPENYRIIQPAGLPVLYEHDAALPLGSVIDLQRTRAALLAVCVLDDAATAEMFADGKQWWFSPGVKCRRTGVTETGDARIFELSLTSVPASVTIRPVLWSRHDIRTDGGGAPRGMPSLDWYGCWERAHERSSSYSRRREPFFIGGPGPVTEPTGPTPSPARPTPTPVRRDAPTVETPGRVYRHSYPGTRIEWQGLPA